MMLENNDNNDIKIELILLYNNTRKLKLTHDKLGLSIEKMLDPIQSVLTQKNKLFDIFNNIIKQYGF